MNKVAPSTLICGKKELCLTSPVIMGILNVTPDSFYDGGRYNSMDSALLKVEQMIAKGAAIIDIGAESTRPKATAISPQEEIDRMMEILLSIKNRFDVIVSVDTYKPQVMREAIAQGVHMINDIYAMANEEAMEIIANNDVGVCLMHIQGSPLTMQSDPHYSHVIDDIFNFLQQRVHACLHKGIARERIIIDPGFGFGKTTDHDLQLLNNLSSFKKMGFPILAGLSRKKFIGELLEKTVQDRLIGSITAQTLAVLNGASIIRTHDVEATNEAIKIINAVKSQESGLQ